MASNPSQDLCQLCRAPIPEQPKAKTNRKYCPTCFSLIAEKGINEAMKIKGNMSDAAAQALIIEQDIRNLAAGIAKKEDLADIMAGDIPSVVSSLYSRTGFSNPDKREQIMNILAKWAMDMKDTATDANYVRCSECKNAFEEKDRVVTLLSKEETILFRSTKLVTCNSCYDKVADIVKRPEPSSEKSPGLNFNSLSLNQAILLGGLNPYDTPQWVLNNPNCWKFIHPAQEDKYIGKLVHNDLIFLGNGILHESNG